ncbi:MAG: alpha/beta hydrolase, partial [Xanthomonadales bacterium]|nr:alpha/beta hydrolase [Xanthomonadales bacterium]
MHSRRTNTDEYRRQLLKGGIALAAGAALPSVLVAATRKTVGSDTPHEPQGASRMNTIITKDGTSIYYKDWGSGPVVSFSHGWPLSADAWDPQMFFLASHGYRCIAHDRRGHGRSSQP